LHQDRVRVPALRNALELLGWKYLPILDPLIFTKYDLPTPTAAEARSYYEGQLLGRVATITGFSIAYPATREIFGMILKLLPFVIIGLAVIFLLPHIIGGLGGLFGGAPPSTPPPTPPEGVTVPP